MVKHLIVVHGRSIKPAEAEMKKLIHKAITLGLERVGDSSTSGKIQSGAIKTSFAY